MGYEVKVRVEVTPDLRGKADKQLVIAGILDAAAQILTHTAWPPHGVASADVDGATVSLEVTGGNFGTNWGTGEGVLVDEITCDLTLKPKPSP